MKKSRLPLAKPLHSLAVTFCLALAITPVAASSFQEELKADWLKQDALRLSSAKPTAAEASSDAAGGVDGKKTGLWGFHTEMQTDPWWQVDLQSEADIGRVVIWNRCDATAERNARIQVKVSSDGINFRQVYEHNGSVFYGQTDQKPLAIALQNVRARFIRLSLTGPNYFHLDEVEVFERASKINLALGKPATQSSVSAWSTPHLSLTATNRVYPTAEIVERGLKLADSQERSGQDVVSARAKLNSILRDSSVPGLNSQATEKLYFDAHETVRVLALGNPLLDFDSILFVKRAPSMFPHMSDQHLGWWSRGGGGVHILKGYKTGNPTVTCLTSDMPEGNFVGPDLSYDGRKLVFAYCKFYPHVANITNKADKANVPEDAFYHVFEMNVDGSNRRQLTAGRYDDFDARYLPNGDVVFISTRKGTTIQCSSWYSDSTRSADLPDSYVRCGGDNFRPVPIFTVHGMDADGKNIRPLSAFENFEWTPCVANDGRIIFTRWDYIDRFNGHFFSLWSANQDGTNPQLVYGNFTVRPQVAIEARPIPGSSKLAFIAAAHHSIYGGSLCLLDRAVGTEGEKPLQRVTPEVPFPETEANVGHYYAHPWPLSEDYFLISWSDQKLPPHCKATDAQNPRNATGIYLLDAFGNMELLHRDPAISSAYPIPLRARPQPLIQSQIAGKDRKLEGRMVLQDVYRGLDGVERGSVKHLRIVAVPPKVQPHINQPNIGISVEDPGKFVLGTVPVEADGSAYFVLPSGLPVFLQALGSNGAALQTMRTLAYVMPGQTLSCVGCHEHRESAPPVGATLAALNRTPSKITPGPEGSWPLTFSELVQPVLDKNCIECHRKDGKEALAAKLDLTAPSAYDSLMSFADGDLKKHAFEKDRSLPGQGTAVATRLWRIVNAPGGHQNMELDQSSLCRLATWLDTYAQRKGHFSEEQATKLVELKRTTEHLFERPGQSGGKSAPRSNKLN